MADAIGSLEHHSVTKQALSALIPVAVNTPIAIQKAPARTSIDLMMANASRGLKAASLPLPIYRASSVGSARSLDNSECIMWYDPIYDDLAHFKEIYALIEKLVAKWTSECAADKTLISSMEMQDLKKIAQQRWKYIGWFLEPPISPAMVTTHMSKEFEIALDAVAKRYASTGIPGGIRASRDRVVQLILQDFDPPDTMVGMPTLASGQQTQLARMTTLLAYPSPLNAVAPGSYVDAVDTLGSSLGLGKGLIYSATVSTRQGPTIKPLPLWVPGAGGYSTTADSVSLYSRQRKVFPAHYPANFILSSLYVQLKSARQSILGLWHTPDLMAEYTKKIASQGKYPYSVDFTQMDMSIGPAALRSICAALGRHGYAPWPLGLLMEYLGRMYALYPSFNNDSTTTAFYGSFGWFSGWKLTSEVDTLFGAATILMSLEALHPGTIKRWERGDFVFAENGDDIQFNWGSPLDERALADVALKGAGAVIKVEPDAVFLKNFLPVSPDVPKLTRPFARLVQQTFFNEDKYSGDKGGTKPDALLRLGLMARMNRLPDHPWFSRWWPDVVPIIMMLGFVRRSSAAYRADLLKGRAVLDSGDELEIQKYAAINPDYLGKLQDRAKYEPSAQFFLEIYQSVTKTVLTEATHLDMRKTMVKALLTPPNHNSVSDLRKMCLWMR